MPIRSILSALALSALALAATCVAMPVAAAPIALLPTSPGTLAATFTQSVDGLFIDTIDFTPSSDTGHVAVTLASVAGPVSFFTADLNGQDFSFFPESGAADFSFSADVRGDVPLILTVFGAVLDAEGNPGGAGSYSGSISVAAVPEGQTWALMLAGLLVVVGPLAARRRARAADGA